MHQRKLAEAAVLLEDPAFAQHLARQRLGLVDEWADASGLRARVMRLTEAPVTISAIELSGVSKRFGATQSLDGLALRVEPGQVFGFLGPNGAGKTTTLRILLGLVRPDVGSVRVLGLDPAVAPREIRASTGVLLETDGLYDRLTAFDNLDYHARIHHLEGAARRSRIDELLQAFALHDRRREPVVGWSKGMRQKLAIARALLHRPRLLLLDEPFSGLDPGAAVELRTRIAALAHEEQVTVFLTTHDLVHVEKSCDRVAVLRAGAVIAEGTLEELSGARSGAEVLVRGAGLSLDVLEAMRCDGVLTSFTHEGETARVRCPAEARRDLGVELVRRGVRLEELRTVGGSLEETFLSLVSGGAHG
jgi:ABC-2 type transport system ATP-binding protein